MLEYLRKIFSRKKEYNVPDKKHLKIPAHIAIIMDGNGRWAQKRGLPRIVGHKVGVESLRAAVNTCDSLGVKYLTVYAFSTENWKRPKEEVDFLINLLSNIIEKETDEIHRKNGRMRIFGRLNMLEATAKDKIFKSMEKTAANTGLNLNILMNYGGRAEIVDAVKKIIELSKTNPDMKVDEAAVSDNLYMAGIPDPDLMIRTGGDMRISNFLLWETAYSEIFVTPTLWPDFREKDILAAVEEYSKRQRRFGGATNA